jgi:hypothetical protein
MPVRQVYSDLSKIINQTMWTVRVEDGKDLHVPYYYRKYPERAPFYDSCNVMSKSKQTIHNMVMMVSADITFSIPDEQDYLSIYNYLEEYTKTLKKYTASALSTNPNVRYLKKCELALKLFKDTRDWKAKKVTNRSKFNEQTQLADVLRNI